MTKAILGFLSLLASCAIGVWKLFGRKAKEKRERIEGAEKLIQEGGKDRDPRKRIAGVDRLNNDV